MLERNTERYVQKKEACNICGISRATLDRWRNTLGFPKNHNPGGRCLFWLPDILNWMAQRPK
jgi:predicted DNA-binding transcriptional regulator AlpA